MIPKNTQVDTDQVGERLKQVGVQEAETQKVETKADVQPTLRPELRAAFEASWERNEEAYRYLGR